MKMRSGLPAALLAGATVLATGWAAPALAEGQLTIVSWGGSYQESQRKAFFEPFVAETGNKITESEYNGEIAKIRAMVETNSVTWDIVDIDSPTLVAACAEGIIEEIDWAKLGLDKEKFVGGGFSPCGVPNIVYSTIYAYDTTKFPEGPTTLADFFDLEKFPGKRGLWKSPYVNMEWALIADGVPADKVYEVLATPEGVEQAFKKLDTIKDQVVWWESGAQPPQLLADGQVVMTTAWNGRIQTAIDKDNKPFKIVWDYESVDWDWWVIPAGSPNLELAYEFIAYASQPELMAEQTKYIAYGPSNKDAVPSIDPVVLPTLPTAPQNMETAVELDSNFWGDYGEEIRERFNAWLAQ